MAPLVLTRFPSGSVELVEPVLSETAETVEDSETVETVETAGTEASTEDSAAMTTETRTVMEIVPLVEDTVDPEEAVMKTVELPVVSTATRTVPPLRPLPLTVPTPFPRSSVPSVSSAALPSPSSTPLVMPSPSPPSLSSRISLRRRRTTARASPRVPSLVTRNVLPVRRAAPSAVVSRATLVATTPPRPPPLPLPLTLTPRTSRPATLSPSSTPTTIKALASLLLLSL
mmetsp:Transcript_21680/g.36305  ORF Transcript_21680/g.36305 Transcript_21680/m.36305 type:complete len:229 (-) Transcript_21680:151-837(-)